MSLRKTEVAPDIAHFASLHLSESPQPTRSAQISLALVSATITLFVHPEVVDPVRDAQAIQAYFAVDSEPSALIRLQ